LIRRIDMIVAHDTLERLQDIACPTPVLLGRDDACTPLHFSQELSSHIPTARLEMLPGGHMVFLEQAEPFAESVDRFLRDVDQRKA
jgi:pimeloyl-ACP methyl ester carboxylesterase